jgi:acetyl esterase/lipase
MNRKMNRHPFIISVAVLALVVFVAGNGFAQSAKVHIKKGIPYCSAQFPGKDKMQKLCFDFYEPDNPGDTLRPLVITLFGGGFVVGTRDWTDMVAWCNRFAENGYAAASIDYRLMSATEFSYKSLVRTGYMAAQDVSAAVRFFKANYEKYGIDTTRIFLLGQSAGAVAIIHALYMDEDERPAETFEEPALSSMHSTGSAEMKRHTFDVAGAVLFWGSIFNTGYIDADEVTPVCLIHGEKDIILPVDSGYAFSVPGLPYVYGSRVIADRLKEMGTTSFESHLLEKEGHAFYFRYLSMYYLDALKFDSCYQLASAFMRKQWRREK